VIKKIGNDSRTIFKRHNYNNLRKNIFSK
jgi:hypothetical protein